jgi:hypothetical protein
MFSRSGILFLHRAHYAIDKHDTPISTTMTTSKLMLKRSNTAPARFVRSHFEPPGRSWQKLFKNRIHKPKAVQRPASNVRRAARSAVQRIAAGAKKTGHRSPAAKNIVRLGALQFAPPSEFDTVLLDAQNPQDAVDRVTIPVDQGVQQLSIKDPYPALEMLIEARLLDQIDGINGNSALASPSRPTPLSTPVHTPSRTLSAFSAVAKKADKLLCDEKI